MAKTTQAGSTSVSAERVKQLWIEKIYREMIVESYFMPRFAGEDQSALMQIKSDLEKQRGDRLNFTMRFKLSGAGQTSGSTLEGNEESLSDAGYTMVLEQYRHAVRDDGALSRQRKVYDLDTESRQALVDWGSEKIDTLAFAALGPGTGAQYLYKQSGTPKWSRTQNVAEAAVTSTDKLDLDFISFLKTFAKTGRNRTFNPLQPVKVDGREYLILLCHPDVLYDLRKDSAFQQAMREAEVRGPSNPLFSGSTAIYQGVVIHEHERVPLKVSGSGSYTTNAAECYLLGQQALFWAWGQRPKLVTKLFDYDNEIGHAWSMIAGVAAPYFGWSGTNYRNGSIIVPLARTAVSDITVS